MNIKRSCIEALGILAFAAALGLGANFFRSDGLSLIRENPVHHTASGNGSETEDFFTIELFLEAMKRPGSVVLDARPEEDFDEAHIPGALNLPEEVCAEEFPYVLQDLPFDQEIIIYCSGIDCGSAEEVAAFLSDVGYTNTKVYLGGVGRMEGAGVAGRTRILGERSRYVNVEHPMKTRSAREARPLPNNVFNRM